MADPGSVLYLTDADVAALELDARSVREAIRDAFAAYAAGKVRAEPKTSIQLGPGHAFQTLSAVDTERGVAAVKWVGMVPPASAAAVNINASILLSDAHTGQLRCLIDARLLTALRTAGMSAEAARHLARDDSSSIGFIGAGKQAESHLAALADVLPKLDAVHVNSATPASAERLAARGRAMGFRAHTGSAREVVAASDVVVTSVPIKAGFDPFLDAEWLRAGACLLAVDLGRSWKHESLARLDLTAVDEEAMKRAAKPGNLVPPLEGAQATLADLVCGRHRGRIDPRARSLFVSSGSAVADLAIAALACERALDRGRGTKLPR